MKQICKLLPLLLLVVFLLAACGGQAEETTQPQVSPEERIYWNVDKNLYGTLRHRTPDPETGLYTIRLAADGEILELQTKRGEVVEYMDTELLFGLTLDENGQIYGIKKLRDFVGTVAVDGRYVESVTEGVVKLKGRGEPSEFTLTEQTQIYDMTGQTAAPGVACELAPGDYIYAVKDKEGAFIRVYVTDRGRTHEDTHLCDCCGKSVTWTQWDGKEETEDGGHYYLASNVTVNKAVELKGKKITLCLNGYKFKSKDCAWVISEGGWLNVTDHKDFEGNYRGILTGSGYEIEKPTYDVMEGDKYQVLRGGVIDSFGTVDLYGGAVVGGEAVNYAGNIQTRGVLNIHEGGLVTAGVADYAGNILVRDGELNLYDGGIISDGVAATEGGNLQVNGAGIFNMYGGLVTRGGLGKAGKTQTARGGNLMIYGTLNMSGGTMSYGNAAQYGGNICTWNSPTINLLQDEKSTTLPTVTSGIAPYAGNIILRGTEPMLHMSYGLVTDGRVEQYAGGIYHSAGNVTLSGTAVIGDNGIADLYIKSGTVTAEGLLEGARIGISMEMPGAFLETEEDLRAFFTCPEGYEIAFDNLQLILRPVA